MLWVLSLHISTMAVWTAAVLYVAVVLHARARQHQLPALPEPEGTQAEKSLADSLRSPDKVSAASMHGEAGFSDSPHGVDSIARFVFTHVASPAAIISIALGSVVFLLNQSHHFWLLAKLTLVTLLCITQAMMGLIIIRAERGKFQHMMLFCRVTLVVLCLLMIAITWIVLGKPVTPGWVEQWI